MSVQADDKVVEQAPSEDLAGPGEMVRDRRETLAAIGKLAAFVAPVTMVLLDAEQARAHHINCSLRPEHSHCN